MAFEMLVGLHVIDDEMYTAYREAMKPILILYKGGFSYDFKVAEVLKHEESSPEGSNINRVFTIYFESKASSDAFFSDTDYLAVKSQYFEHSVGGTTIIASYETK